MVQSGGFEGVVSNKAWTELPYALHWALSLVPAHTANKGRGELLSVDVELANPMGLQRT